MLHPALAPVTALCCYICYLDLRRGVIRNRHILILLALGIAFQSLFGILLSSPLLLLSVFAYGSGISFFLWWLGIWPGGDAKLFSALLLLFTPGIYGSGLVVSFLAASFLPFFFFMSAYAAARGGLKRVRQAASYSLRPYRLASVLLIIVGFMWFFSEAIGLLGLQADYFVIIVVLFLVYEAFSAALSYRTEVLFVALAALRIALDPWGFLSLETAGHILSVAGAFVFLRFFVLHITYHAFTRRVPLSRLEAGMVPAEAIGREGGRYTRASLLNSSLVSFLQQKRGGFIHSLEALTREEAEWIRDLRKRGKISFSSLRVYQTQPFSPFILAGYLLVLLLYSTPFWPL